MKHRRLLHGVMIAAILSLSPGRAWAHAVIVESTPAMNGVVTGPVLDVKLRFNSRIDSGRSKLTLISADGNSHAVSLSQQTSPDMLLAKVSDLAPGKYRLHWQVLASDGHITQGNIPFSVVNPYRIGRGFRRGLHADRSSFRDHHRCSPRSHAGLPVAGGRRHYLSSLDRIR